MDTIDLNELFGDLEAVGLNPVAVGFERKPMVKDVLRSFIRYGDFTLASGKKSKYYIDIWQDCFAPQFFKQIYKEFISHYREIFNCMVGPELGAAPLISSLLAQMPTWCHHVHGAIIRQQPKHDSYIEGSIRENDRILLIDDVITTGGSLKRAIDSIRPQYPNIDNQIVGVFCILDRQEGYDMSYPLHSLVKIDEIL